MIGEIVTPDGELTGHLRFHPDELTASDCVQLLHIITKRIDQIGQLPDTLPSPGPDFKELVGK